MNLAFWRPKPSGNRYGWKPDVPDFRDYMLAPPVMAAAPPPSVDLRTKCPAVYDQGQLGSCTANAIGFAYEFDQLKQNPKGDFMPSRLFIYYNERAMEGSVRQDAGAQIRDGIKSINVQGVCPEPIWPYNPAKFAVKPCSQSYKAALTHKSVSYQRVLSTIDNIKNCLAAGLPFVFGFAVYSSFESVEVARTGIMNMPKPGEKMLGGHAVACVGYDDASQRVIVRNSWGTTWGQNGYFTMPYAYITNGNLCDDFWVVQTIMPLLGIK